MKFKLGVMVKERCECNRESIDHEKGKCENTATWLVHRDGIALKVCVHCVIRKDRPMWELKK